MSVSGRLGSELSLDGRHVTGHLLLGDVEQVGGVMRRIAAMTRSSSSTGPTPGWAALIGPHSSVAMGQLCELDTRPGDDAATDVQGR